MYDIYYAHHRWKFYTRVEEYEIDLIRKHFPNGIIFDPSRDIDMKIVIYRDLAMRERLKAVDSSDIIVFSSLDGIIDSEVYQEIMRAREKEKQCLYIYYGKLLPSFKVAKLSDGKRNEQSYALVMPEVNFNEL